MKNLHLPFLSLWIMFALLTSCKTTKSTVRPTKSTKFSFVDSLNYQFDNNILFNNIFTGFALYDPQKDKMLFEENAHKYYTPASNTKLFTLYTALSILGDSIPGIRYEIRNDSLLFWGTGDPSLMYSEIGDSSIVIEFLKTRKEKLFFCPGNFHDEVLGSGWAWDDYNSSYQAEKSAMPIYGNLVQFKGHPHRDSTAVIPNYFEKKMLFDPTVRRVLRKKFENSFDVNPALFKKEDFKRNVPFIYSDQLLVELLSEAIGKKVELGNPHWKAPENALLFYTQLADTLFKKMIQPSDNFVAEQLLLLSSDKLYGELNTKKVIDYAKDSLLADLPDEPIWVDGSGLSRYNLFTPRSIVKLLLKIHQKISQERIEEIFPSGGYSGTIEHWYGGDTPYVFAKTGTLRHKHCLSGYVKTKSNKTLIFSFMNNNYTTSSSIVKPEMEKILRYIYEWY